MRIEQAGIHDIDEATYHGDPCPEPSLSSSIASILIEQSPRHAWFAHPRLNPAHEPDNNSAFDIGRAAHSMMLRGLEAFEVLAFDDFRKADARVARDAAYAAGRTPILAHQLPKLRAMVEAGRAQLAQHEAHYAFADGKPEQAVVWKEDGVWCRSLIDWLPNSKRTPIICDYKSTTNAEPAAWSRSKIAAMGYDLQAAFYLRGLRAQGYTADKFAFVVQETEPPYALSVVGLAPALLEIGEQKAHIAIRMWRECIQSGNWPAYPPRICWVEPQPWDGARWLERLERPTYSPEQLDRARKAQAPLEDYRV